MKKVILSVAALLFMNCIAAQNDIGKNQNVVEKNEKKVKPVKTDADNRFTITYDYLTGTINHHLPVGFKIKRIRPKVGAFICIKVLNLPDNYTVSGEAEFENGNIEGAGMFGSFFKPEATSTTGTPPADKKPLPDSTEKKADTILVERTAAINKKTNDSINKKAEAYATLLKKNQKLNINNFEEVLQTGDVKNYLFSNNRAKDNLLSAAKADYNWQQFIIDELKKNMLLQLKLRDSMIAALSKSVDKEIQEKPTVVVRPINIKPIADIQVPNSDIVNLKITVKDKNSNIVSTVPLSYYNRAGYKIDFSTGFFHTTLADQEYKAVNKFSSNTPFTSIDTVYQIKQKEKGNGKIAIGILAHYYPRWFKYFNIAASCGFSYQAENRIINFLTGLSALCGNQQRFIISGGVSFGKVKEIDKNFFITGQDYHRSVLNDKTEIPVTERLKSSLFFGVSYNLGTINNAKSFKRTF